MAHMTTKAGGRSGNQVIIDTNEDESQDISEVFLSGVLISFKHREVGLWSIGPCEPFQVALFALCE